MSSGFTFEPGDRAPNFTLPDRDGRNVMFYAWVEGRPVALLLAPSLDAARAALPGWSARAAEFRAVGVDVLAVVRGTQAEVAGAITGEMGAMVMADPHGQVTGGFGATSTASRVLLLDGNQRVMRLLDGVPSQAQAATALDWYRAQPAPPPVAPMRGAAPVLMVPRVLDDATCDALIQRWHGQNEEGRSLAMVGGQAQNTTYGTKKHTRDHYISDQATFNQLSNLIVRRVGPELNKAFGFGGAFRFDSHSVLSYAAERGDRFENHRDNLLPQSAHRRFAISLNLNDDYEGGELCFPEYGPGLYKPARGEACLFSCSLLHAARPVTSGRRFVLVTIIADPPQQPGAPRA